MLYASNLVVYLKQAEKGIGENNNDRADALLQRIHTQDWRLVLLLSLMCAYLADILTSMLDFVAVMLKMCGEPLDSSVISEDAD